MGRAPGCDKVDLKKGPWTPDEDQKLIAYIQRNGHGSWRALPSHAGLSRCGKSCRLRWVNYLGPNIKRGRFSFEEERIIIQLHALLGNRWSQIASHLPGRTDNEIKNYWNTHLKKRLLQSGIDPVTHLPKMDFYNSLTPCIPSLAHLAQWESARLEAEERLVRDSLNISLSQSDLLDGIPKYVSPDILSRLLGSQTAEEYLNRVSLRLHTGRMDHKNTALRNWKPSPQAQLALLSQYSQLIAALPDNQNCDATSISCLHDMRSGDVSAPFKLQGLKSSSPTSTLSSSSVNPLVKRLTLPFLEKNGESCSQNDAAGPGSMCDLKKPTIEVQLNGAFGTCRDAGNSDLSISCSSEDKSNQAHGFFKCNDNLISTSLHAAGFATKQENFSPQEGKNRPTWTERQTILRAGLNSGLFLPVSVTSNPQ